MLQGLFLAMSEILNRMLADHLPEFFFDFQVKSKSVKHSL